MGILHKSNGNMDISMKSNATKRTNGGRDSAPDKALADLIRISNLVGQDPALVQGGGGNTSVKTADGKYMYIKASGTALKDMNATRGWRRMGLDAVLAIIKDKSITRLPTQTREVEVVNRLLLACDDDVTNGSRPSVEAHLHGLLDACVIHLHPSAVSAYLNAREGKARLEKLFRDERTPPLWVPYVNPGYTLARTIDRLVAGYRGQFKRMPRILFLDKHGLFVTAPTADTTLRLVRRVIERCGATLRMPAAARTRLPDETQVRAAQLCVRRAYFEATGTYCPVTYTNDCMVAGFERYGDAQKLLSCGPLTPDELVYSNGPALWVDRCDAAAIARRLRLQIGAGRKPAAAFLVKGVGLFIAGAGRIAQTVRDVVAYSLFIRANARRMGGIRALTRGEQKFINEWESEAFRMKLVSGERQGDLHNRITVVTGAGSGLGRSIALGLARAGALVALADIDETAARETADVIAGERPKSQVTVIRCDVTSEDSVRRTFEELLAYWGGLDILVNAAGIAPPYALVDMPVDKWRLALEVNLTGYFLMSREAARIMTAQGMGGSIVNLSSKSGLDASKNNTAYNATKAGELHMARGWALELGEHGIRVNCIAPGNVFEGSKIWNPQYIKVCAKKNGIKPEEVIPFYVNKTALRREIKGQDVADAVVFLCSDRARTITGQTLVPDSGQVMVR
jgi:NAD(P)-dependent dehydrogenase (short-subunit alcohol dehydrogenase family)/rhamnose utilization protein RhaD (predicted bifunctional aldolase and dehydrogenase)